MKFTTLLSVTTLAVPAALAQATPKIFSISNSQGDFSYLNVTIQLPNPQPVPNKQLGIAFYLTQEGGKPSVATFAKGFDASVSGFYKPTGKWLEHTFTVPTANWTQFYEIHAVNWYQWTGNSSFGTASNSAYLGLLDSE